MCIRGAPWNISSKMHDTFCIRTVMKPTAALQAFSCSFTRAHPHEELIVCRSNYLDVYEYSSESFACTAEASAPGEGLKHSCTFTLECYIVRVTPLLVSSSEQRHNLMVETSDRRIKILTYDGARHGLRTLYELISPVVSPAARVSTVSAAAPDGLFIVYQIYQTEVHIVLSDRQDRHLQLQNAPRMYAIIDIAISLCSLTPNGRVYLIAFLWADIKQERMTQIFSLTIPSATSPEVLSLVQIAESFSLPPHTRFLRATDSACFAFFAPYCCGLVSADLKAPVIIMVPASEPLYVSHAGASSLCADSSTVSLTPSSVFLSDISGTLIYIRFPMKPSPGSAVDFHSMTATVVGTVTKASGILTLSHVAEKDGSLTAIMFLSSFTDDSVLLRLVIDSNLKSEYTILSTYPNVGPVAGMVAIGSSNDTLLKLSHVGHESSEFFDPLQSAHPEDGGEPLCEEELFDIGDELMNGAPRVPNADKDFLGLKGRVSTAFEKTEFGKCYLANCSSSQMAGDAALSTSQTGESSVPNTHGIAFDEASSEYFSPSLVTVSGYNNQGSIKLFRKGSMFEHTNGIPISDVKSITSIGNGYVLLKVHSCDAKKYGTVLVKCSLDPSTDQDQPPSYSLSLLPPLRVAVSLFDSSLYAMTAPVIASANRCSSCTVVVSHDSLLAFTFNENTPTIIAGPISVSMLAETFYDADPENGARPVAHLQNAAITHSACSNNGRYLCLALDNGFLMTIEYTGYVSKQPSDNAAAYQHFSNFKHSSLLPIEAQSRSSIVDIVMKRPEKLFTVIAYDKPIFKEKEQSGALEQASPEKTHGPTHCPEMMTPLLDPETLIQGNRTAFTKESVRLSNQCIPPKAPPHVPGKTGKKLLRDILAQSSTRLSVSKLAISDDGCVAIAFDGVPYICLFDQCLNTILDALGSAHFRDNGVSTQHYTDKNGSDELLDYVFADLFSGKRVGPSDDPFTLALLRNDSLNGILGDNCAIGEYATILAACPYSHEEALVSYSPYSLCFVGTSNNLLMTTRQGSLHVYEVFKCSTPMKEYYLCAGLMATKLSRYSIRATPTLNSSIYLQCHAHEYHEKPSSSVDNNTFLLDVKNSCAKKLQYTLRPVMNGPMIACPVPQESCLLLYTYSSMLSVATSLATERVYYDCLRLNGLPRRLVHLPEHSAFIVAVSNIDDSSSPGVSNRNIHCAMSSGILDNETGLLQSASVGPPTSCTSGIFSNTFTHVNLADAPQTDQQSSLLFFDQHTLEILGSVKLSDDAIVSKMCLLTGCFNHSEDSSETLGQDAMAFLVVGMSVQSTTHQDQDIGLVQVYEVVKNYGPQLTYGLRLAAEYRFAETGVTDIEPFVNSRLVVASEYICSIFTLVDKSYYEHNKDMFVRQVVGENVDVPGSRYMLVELASYLGSVLILKISTKLNRIALVDLFKGVSVIEDKDYVIKNLCDKPYIGTIGQLLHRMAPSAVHLCTPSGPIFVGDRLGYLYIVEINAKTVYISSRHYVGEQINSFAEYIPAVSGRIRARSEDGLLGSEFFYDRGLGGSIAPVMYATIAGRIGCVFPVAAQAAMFLKMVQSTISDVVNGPVLRPSDPSADDGLLRYLRRSNEYESTIIDCDIIGTFLRLSSEQRLDIANMLNESKFTKMSVQTIDAVISSLDSITEFV